MKRLLIIFFIFCSSVWIFSAFTAPIAIDYGKVEKNMALFIAESKISSAFGNAQVAVEPIELSGLDDHLSAYLFLVSFDGKAPSLSRFADEIRFRASKKDDEASFSLNDIAGYIIISARMDNNVVLEYGRGVPYFISNWDRIKKYFKLNDSGKLYYTGHGRFFYEDKDEVFDLAEYKKYANTPFHPVLKINEKWSNVQKTGYKAGNSKSSNYIPGVPFVLWSYGCSPTTSSMIFSYYDSRGYGDFVDYYFKRFDNVMGIYRANVPSAQRELAYLMETDSVNTGGTSVYDIRTPNQDFANTAHPYSFVCGQHIYGQTAEGFYYTYIKAEVDSGRPAHWAVLDYYYGGEYIGHSIVSIGYDDGGTDTLVQIHNTWDYTEPFWNLYTYNDGYLSYSCFYEIKPFGGNSYRIGNLNISGKKYFKGLKGIVGFSNLSDSLNSIKLYYTVTDYVSKTYVGEVFDTIFYFTPALSGDARINAEFLNSGSQIIATDGIYSSVSIASISDTNNISIYSYTSDLSTAFDMILKGDTVIAAGGASGIIDYSISDSTLMTKLSQYSDGNSYRELFEVNDSILCAGTENRIFMMKRIGHSYSKIDSFSMPSSLSDFHYNENTIFAVTSTSLYVVNVDSGYNLHPADTFSEGTRKSYTSVSTKDSIVYLSDMLNGIYILKTDYPSTGLTQIELFSTAYPEGFLAVKDSILYLAAVTNGIVLYSVSNPSNLQFIQNITETGTVNKLKAETGGLTCYDNALGASFYRYSDFSEVSHIYLYSKVTSSLIDSLNEKIYICDNNNGIFAGSYSPVSGIGHYDRKIPSPFISFISTGDGIISLVYDVSVTGSGLIRIIDLSGRIIAVENVYLKMNENKLNLKSIMKSGVYFVQVSYGGSNYIGKVAIIK